MSDFLDPHPGWIAVGGPDHLAFIAILVATGLALVLGRGWVRDHARTVRIGVLVVSLAQQCLLYGAYLAAGWDWSEALPLHVSRISAILGIVYLATGSKRVMDVLFYFGLWSWFSFLYPSQVQPITNVFGWSFVINHTITLLMPVLAWVTTDWRPSRRALHRAFAWLVAYSLIALGANALTGGNYFYQRDMPVMGFVGQPWYWLGTLALGYAINWAAYGVSQLVDRRDSPVASTPAVLVA